MKAKAILAPADNDARVGGELLDGVFSPKR
jgi:hypothetical protein